MEILEILLKILYKIGYFDSNYSPWRLLRENSGENFIFFYFLRVYGLGPYTLESGLMSPNMFPRLICPKFRLKCCLLWATQRVPPLVHGPKIFKFFFLLKCFKTSPCTIRTYFLAYFFFKTILKIKWSKSTFLVQCATISTL